MSLKNKTESDLSSQMPRQPVLPLDQRLKVPISNYALSSTCPACGTDTFRHACKVRCPRCGFAWDCSEL